MRKRKSPLVSVIMPVRDPHPVYFREAVESILTQSCADLELLIVEGPSERSARDALAGIRDRRVRFFCSAGRTTVVERRNWGIAEARADFIANLDSDDVAEPNRLQEQLQYLCRHLDTDVLGSQIRIINASGQILGYRSFPLEHAAIVRELRRCVPLSHPSIMVRKKALLAVGGYAFGYPVEDYDLYARLAAAGARFANHPEFLTRYRIHPSQVKQACLQRTIRGTLAIKRRYWQSTMTCVDRLRMWVERCMLFLPPRLVLYLFMKTHYHPAPAALTSRHQDEGRARTSQGTTWQREAATSQVHSAKAAQVAGADP